MDGLREKAILLIMNNYYIKAIPPETLKQGREWLQRRFNTPKEKLYKYSLKRIRAIFKINSIVELKN